jgi:hypothetical protein
MLLLWEERKGQHLFWKGKWACMDALGSCVEGWPEDVATWRFAAAAGIWSRVTSGLNRDGRQPVVLVGPKGCLSRILLWRSYRLAKLGTAMGRVRVGYNNYPPVNKGVAGRNSYPYLYPRVEIRTRTHQVSDGYRVPVGFVIPHVKNHIKIISLMSKTQYTHVQN